MAKCALITGGAKRLGRAMALYLAQNEYDVAIHYATSQEDANDTVASIKALGKNAIMLRADLTNEREFTDLIACAAQNLGGALSILINNASIFEYDSFETATRMTWDRHMESNLRAAFLLSQKFSKQAPKAIRDGNGELKAQSSIVNIIDQRVRKLTPEFATYTLAKSALWTMTQTAARAFAPNIRVNAIGPGPTLRAKSQSQEHFQMQRNATILNRGANLDDITHALGFLISAPAITGQLICVDGGQSLAWNTPDIGKVE